VVGAVTVVAAIVGSVAARSAIQALRAEPAVPQAVLSQAWTKQTLGGKAFSFDSPLPLAFQPVELPESVRSQIREMSSVSGEGQGLNVMGSYMALPAGRTPSLDGAAEGALANVRKTPGTLSVEAKKHETTLAGQPAIEVEAEVRRKDAEPLALHIMVASRGEEMYQLMLLHRQDQPTGVGVWRKLLDSVKIGG